MGFAPLSNGSHLWFPVPSAPAGDLPTFSHGFRRGLPRFPFIDLIPGVRLPAVLPPLRTRAASSNRVPTSSFRTTSSGSPPISWVFTRIFVTVQDDEGLAGLLHPAADRRVRCVSVAPPGGVGPRSVTIAGGVPCRSLGLRLPASKFVPLGGFPSPAAVARLRARCPLGLFAVSGPRPSRQLRFQRCRSCRTGGTRSLEALLRE